ncbi:MAG: TIGR03668 family PPOX class F420-dependent oxidoreductase [Actinomycetota bacterium]
MNRLEAVQRFGEARVARLATVGPRGPHLVPCTFALAGERIVSVVDRKPKRTTALQRLANIRSEPRVSLLVDRYDEDWIRLWWVRADGRAAIEEGGPELVGAVAALTGKYPQYARQPPPGPAIVVTVERWAWWSALPG